MLKHRYENRTHYPHRSGHRRETRRLRRGDRRKSSPRFSSSPRNSSPCIVAERPQGDSRRAHPPVRRGKMPARPHHRRHRARPDDIMPDVTLEVVDRKLPGFGEVMRYYSYERFKVSVLSRAEAGVRGKSLIINLPARPKPVKFCLQAAAGRNRRGAGADRRHQARPARRRDRGADRQISARSSRSSGPSPNPAATSIR